MCITDVVAESRRDPRIRALLLVGSLASGRTDAYSDIDLVLVAEDDGVDALLADRLAFPRRLGEVLLQLDSSWNVWSGAAQVVTLLDGPLPLWVDIDIWAASAAGTPSDARVLAGRAAERVGVTLAELTEKLKAAHGPGTPLRDNAPGAFEVAQVAWHLKAIGRGNGDDLSVVEQALDGPWPPALERAREPLWRFARHVADQDAT